MRIACTKLKIVVDSPMAIPRTSTAIAVKPGLLRNIRRASRASRQRSPSHHDTDGIASFLTNLLNAAQLPQWFPPRVLRRHVVLNILFGLDLGMSKKENTHAAGETQAAFRG